MPSDLRIDVLLPRSKDGEKLAINAVHRWTDDGYSPSHKQIGLQFLGLDDDVHDRVVGLVNTFISEKEHFFRCRLYPM